MQDDLMKRLEKAGYDKARVDKLLYGDGLADMMTKATIEVEKQVANYIADVKKRCDRLGGTQHLRVVAEQGWRECFNKLMSRRVYDLYIKAAEEYLRPGLKEGHHRTNSTLDDALQGRSGNIVADIIIVMLEESQKKAGEK